MANLTIKPSSTADSFIMTDANSTPNTILTIDGQSDSSVTTTGRITYGKGVNETLGTATQASAVMTIDLGTGTFFAPAALTAQVDTWKILHLPPTGIIAAWVVKIIQKASGAVTNAWTGNAASTFDNGSAFAVCTPVFHWAGGTDHVMSTGVNDIDIISFWTQGGDDPVIYGAVSGADFLT